MPRLFNYRAVDDSVRDFSGRILCGLPPAAMHVRRGGREQRVDGALIAIVDARDVVRGELISC